MNNKKLHFWRLAFIFGGITILTLFFLWTRPQENKAKMMNTSMGNMMKSEHAQNITLNDLFSKVENSSKMEEMHSHHQNQEPVILNLSFFITTLIFLLLPFIIGGAIILAIAWVN